MSKGNIFNGDSYKAIFARAIYKRLMSSEWVTFAEIMTYKLVQTSENKKKETHITPQVNHSLSLQE